jgi:hypothetical protein
MSSFNFVIRFADRSRPVHFSKAELPAMAERYGFYAEDAETSDLELRDDDGDTLIGWVLRA